MKVTEPYLVFYTLTIKYIFMSLSSIKTEKSMTKLELKQLALYPLIRFVFLIYSVSGSFFYLFLYPHASLFTYIHILSARF